MSCSKLAALALIACVSVAHAGDREAPQTCPSYKHGAAGDHRLSLVSVFDGPPAKLVELMGGDAGWDELGLFPTHQFFLVCHYGPKLPPTQVTLRLGVQACLNSKASLAGKGNVDCR